MLSKQPGGAGRARASAPFACFGAGKRQPISERAELDRNTDSAISIAKSPETAEAWIERLPRRFDSACATLKPVAGDEVILVLRYGLTGPRSGPTMMECALPRAPSNQRGRKLTDWYP